MTARITLYTHRFYPSLGGVEISSRMMAQALVALGYTVTVVTQSGLGGSPELDEGYRILRAPGFAALRAAARGADLFIVRGGLSQRGVLGGALGRARVLVLHEMMSSGPVPWKTRALYPLVHTHLGVTHAVLETKSLPEKARTGVLYNPVSPALWPAAPRPLEARDIDLLFVGRLGAKKGIIEFAKACVALPTPPRTVIVGDGPKRAEVAEILHACPGAQFLGPQQGAALSELYARARAFVLPSYEEGMGMVVAEAMAHGTPALVSAIPTLRETVGQGGLTFAPRSAEAVAEAATQVFGEPPLWQRLSDAAWAERDRFSMTAYRATLKTLLHQALAG